MHGNEVKVYVNNNYYDYKRLQFVARRGVLTANPVLLVPYKYHRDEVSMCSARKVMRNE